MSDITTKSASTLASGLAKGVTDGYNSVNNTPNESKYIDPSSIGIDVSKLPEGYRDVFNSIPSLRYSDSRSGLMKFSDALGITNYLQKLQADAELQARTDYNQLMNLAREEKTNSALSQVERLRQAGINADLVGNVSAGEASEFNEPEQRYEYPGLGLSEVGSFISSIPQAITNAMSMYSAFQGIRSQGIDLVNKQINSANSNFDSVFKLLMNSLTKSDFDAIVNGVFTRGFSDESLASLGITSRAAKRQANYMLRLSGNSFQRMLSVYKSYDDFDKTREDFLRRRAMPWFSSDDSNMGAAFKEVNQYLWKAEQAEAKLRYHLAFRQNNYNTMRSGAEQALAENSRDSYTRKYYEMLSPIGQAAAANNEASYKSDYYNSLNGSKMASFDFALKEYQKSMSLYRKNLIDGLLKNGDAYCNLLAFQLISGVNPMTEFVSNVSKIAPTLGVSK